MHNQMGKIGNIRRILEGKACQNCHGHQYQLVLRGDMALQAGDSLPAALSASVLADSMRTSTEYFGCNRLPLFR